MGSIVKDMSAKKIVVTGAAGLVGQNLIPRLKGDGTNEIVAIDKHHKNIAILRGLHPELRVVEADLAEHGAWERELEGCTHLVILHAQIGGLYHDEYVRNNVTASERLMEAAVRAKVPYAVSISSSVVNSMAVDNYTESKKAQEALLLAGHGIPHIVLRPTLMFGWFDRKHVGWLARFMQKTPVFQFQETASICASRCTRGTSARSLRRRWSARPPGRSRSRGGSGSTTST